MNTGATRNFFSLRIVLQKPINKSDEFAEFSFFLGISMCVNILIIWKNVFSFFIFFHVSALSKCLMIAIRIRLIKASNSSLISDSNQIDLPITGFPGRDYLIY